MKPKSLVLLSALLGLGLSTIAACGGKPTITIWVGDESTEFYREYANKWIEEQTNGIPYQISVVGTDVGSNGGTMLSDNTACGDIVTIAHDNIGKLSQAGYILPFGDQTLVNQIKADNPASFIEVVQNYYGTDKTTKYFFGAPYISQALFLYYNTKLVSEEQAKTIEGLKEAARAVGPTVAGLNCLGTDGFNFSYSLLARKLPENTSDTVIYQGLDYTKVYAQSNEQLAISRTFQELYENKFIMFPSSSGWAVDLQTNSCVAMVGGAWNYNAIKKALTEGDKCYMGCSLIPTFKLSATACEGITATTNIFTGKEDPAPVAGTEYRGGTFADCKCFVINAAAKDDKIPYLTKLITYLSSKEVQKESFKRCSNVPAFNGAANYIESIKDSIDPTLYQMAKAQTGMAEYGIAQPFVDARMNNFYYQDKAPDLYVNAIKNEDKSYSTVDSMRKMLFKMEYIWRHGAEPASYPDTLPASTTDKR